MTYFQQLFENLSIRSRNALGGAQLDTEFEFIQYVKHNKDFKKLRNIGKKSQGEISLMFENLKDYYSNIGLDYKLVTVESDLLDNSILIIEDEVMEEVPNIKVDLLKSVSFFSKNPPINLNEKYLNHEISNTIYYLETLEYFIRSEYLNQIENAPLRVEFLNEDQKTKLTKSKYKIFSKIKSSLKYFQPERQELKEWLATKDLKIYSPLTNALKIFIVQKDNLYIFEEKNHKIITEIIKTFKNAKIKKEINITDELLIEEPDFLELILDLGCTHYQGKITNGLEDQPLEKVYQYLLVEGLPRKIEDIVDHFLFDKKVENYLRTKLIRDNRFQKIGKTGLVSLSQWHTGEINQHLKGTVPSNIYNLINHFNLPALHYSTINKIFKCSGIETTFKSITANITLSSTELRISGQKIFSTKANQFNEKKSLDHCRKILNDFQSDRFENIFSDCQYLSVLHFDNYKPHNIVEILKLKQDIQKIGKTKTEKILKSIQKPSDIDLIQDIFQIDLKAQFRTNVLKGNIGDIKSLIYEILDNGYIDYSEYDYLLERIDNNKENIDLFINTLKNFEASEKIDFPKQVTSVLTAKPHLKKDFDALIEEFQYLFLNTLSSVEISKIENVFNEIIKSDQSIVKTVNVKGIEFTLNTTLRNFSGLTLDFDFKENRGIVSVFSNDIEEQERMIISGIIGILLNRNSINPLEVYSYTLKVEKIIKSIYS
jgi:hypothetical protein